MIYIIDLREENELGKSRIISRNNNVTVISIPSRHIFANKEFITNLSNQGKVYLLCRSGNRSLQLKNKYFKNNENITSIDNGLKALEQFGDNIEIIKGSSGLGMQQYMQIVFAFIIIGTIIAIFMNVKKIYVLIALTLFLLFILYQIFSSSCILSKIIPYKL